MKIACIGNMNNMMFTLCRYLRDEGFDANLLVFSDEAAHFNPLADTYSDDYKDFTSQLAVSKSELFNNNKVSQTKLSLSKFDFFIGTDIAPALLTILGIGLDVYIPHGSDIYSYPFYRERKKDVNRIWWLNSVFSFRKVQKIGIKNTNIILFPDEYDLQFPFRKKLNTKSKFYNTSGPMIYVPQYNKLKNDSIVKKLEYAQDFLEIRTKNELIIFSHSRHNGFNLPLSLKVHQKGNDVLIIGFSNFVKQQPLIKSCLILFDYGMNVKESKDLIAELGIENRVVWMPMMHRKEIMFGLSLADLSCGQFDSSWLTCGVVNETLALGIPLLHYRDDAVYANEYDELYPILKVKSSDELTTQINYYLKNKDSVKMEAMDGVSWLEKNSVEKPIKIILELIGNVELSKKVNSWTKFQIFFIKFENTILQIGLKSLHKIQELPFIR